jgi:hypothetical protein
MIESATESPTNVTRNSGFEPASFAVLTKATIDTTRGKKTRATARRTDTP